jgi:hypothetical protein
MSVTPDHAGAVRFSAARGGRGAWIDVSVVDVGLGGVGVCSPVFIPRRTRIRLRLTPVPGTESAPAGPLEFEARVQRAWMRDRTPTYLLGTAFIDPDPRMLARIESMVEQLAGAGAAQAGTE